jgi:predicted nucleic acid-binding protein
MAVLIDSSVFIALERRGLLGQDVLPAIGEESAALASMTASELLHGVYRANSEERRVRRQAFVEAILSAVRILPFDLSAARIHAQVSAQLLASGRQIGAHDLIIGATALANQVDVLTVNLRDFVRIPGLVVRQPEW